MTERRLSQAARRRASAWIFLWDLAVGLAAALWSTIVGLGVAIGILVGVARATA